MDWDRYVKSYELTVNDIKVHKTVSKADVVMSLMTKGDLAFKFENGQMVINLDKINDIKLLEELIWKPIKEYVERIKLSKLKDENTNKTPM